MEILSLIESLLDGVMEHRGNCIDFAYSIKGEQNQSSLRFRVNATTFTQVGAAGWQMTLRCLPGLPPDFSQFNLDPEVAHTMLGSKQGLILVTGATGSGKSTLISSILRQSLETKENRVVYTFEDPIEYVYDEVETKGINRVIQQDPKQMGESYSQSIFRATKRRPTEIFIGEARDKETIEQAINAALSGHLTYSTVFGNGCADVVKRMLNVFDVEDRNSYMVDLISTLRIVVGMKRVEGERGVRVALFETLIMDDDLVDRLIEGGLEHLSLNINQTLKSRGMDFVADAERKRNAGLISERTFKHLQRQYTS